jgi:hypothetical protein
MAEDVTSHASRAIELHGEWVGVVIGGRRHRQPNYDPGPFVEYPSGNLRRSAKMRRRTSRLHLMIRRQKRRDKTRQIWPITSAHSLYLECNKITYCSARQTSAIGKSAEKSGR